MVSVNILYFLLIKYPFNHLVASCILFTHPSVVNSSTLHILKWYAPLLQQSVVIQSYSCFLFLPSLRKHILKHFTVTVTQISSTVARNTITSRQKYWIQFRSWTAGLRCFAPLCRITNSVQYTERSMGSIGRSLWRAESLCTFSLYLHVNRRCTRL